MTIEAAFYSDHPDVLKAIEDSNQAYEFYKIKVSNYQQRWPDHKITAFQNSHRIWVGGLKGEKPAYWFRKHKEGYWVPDKRTTEGKAEAETIKSLSIKFPTLPGMPDEIFQGWVSYFPGMHVFDEGVWITYGVDPNEENLELIDFSKWDRMKISDYYLAREAQEANA